MVSSCMTIRAEIWRDALQLVRCYGPEASARAAIRAAQCFVRGEPDRMAEWQLVVDAIAFLETDQRSEGATIH